MQFTKMHGLGNDYIYVDCSSQTIDDPAALARRISDRHFGVGSDGLILISPSESADVAMRIFNADGSQAQTCGNGLRCVAKYAWDHELARKNPMQIETLAGVKNVNLTVADDGEIVSVTVDMGEPILAPAEIPMNFSGGDRVVDFQLQTTAGDFTATCLSMGNPHAVIYTDDASAVDLERSGPAIENLNIFPERINVHFVQVHSPGEVTMRTWERGSGITLACGTGASAVCAAGVLGGRTDRKITAHLPGGDLLLEWREADDHIYMTGPAEEVFTGYWPG